MQTTDRPEAIARIEMGAKDTSTVTEGPPPKFIRLFAVVVRNERTNVDTTLPLSDPCFSAAT